MSVTLAQQVAARARSPRFRGFLGTYDAAARGTNPTCGDDIEVRLAFSTKDGAAVVSRAHFEGYACSLCVASADALLEYARGRTADKLRVLTPDDVRRLLGGVDVRPARQACLTLPLEALLTCLNQA